MSSVPVPIWRELVRSRTAAKRWPHAAAAAPEEPGENWRNGPPKFPRGRPPVANFGPAFALQRRPSFAERHPQFARLDSIRYLGLRFSSPPFLFTCEIGFFYRYLIIIILLDFFSPPTMGGSSPYRSMVFFFQTKFVMPFQDVFLLWIDFRRIQSTDPCLTGFGRVLLAFRQWVSRCHAARWVFSR